jgi:RND family efflux transporter MFP subunit
VVAPEAARVAEMPKAEGDRVRRGDVLVRFEIPTLSADAARQRAEVGRAGARITNAQAARQRAHDLFDRGIAARKEVEDADRELADAEADLAGAQATRAAAETVAARTVVRAAFDGIVARRSHNPGDLVEATAADAVLRVINPARLEVSASIPLGDVGRIAIGATARLAGNRGDMVLTVASRPAAVEAGTASVPIRLTFVTPPALPVGAPVEVAIDAEEHRDVVVIPAAAIVREGEDTAVFIAAGDKAQRRAVTLGLADDMTVEVRSGIKPGDSVIVDGQAGLPDGATITTGGRDKAATGGSDGDARK